MKKITGLIFLVICFSGMVTCCYTTNPKTIAKQLGYPGVGYYEKMNFNSTLAKNQANVTFFNGYIIEAYIVPLDIDSYKFKIKSTNSNNEWEVYFHGDNECIQAHDSSHFVQIYQPDDFKLIDETKVYDVYIAKIDKCVYIDRVAGIIIQGESPDFTTRFDKAQVEIARTIKQNREANKL